jgi:hypothetical protein
LINSSLILSFSRPRPIRNHFYNNTLIDFHYEV